LTGGSGRNYKSQDNLDIEVCSGRFRGERTSWSRPRARRCAVSARNGATVCGGATPASLHTSMRLDGYSGCRFILVRCRR